MEVEQVFVTQAIKEGDFTTEYRTLQVKRPQSSAEAIEQRKTWERFGQAKGKIGREVGVTDTLKEEVLIEPVTEELEPHKNRNDAASDMKQRLASRGGLGRSIARKNSGPLPQSGTPDLGEDILVKQQGE